MTDDPFLGVELCLDPIVKLPKPRQVTLPERDEEEPEPETRVAEAEGQTFMIEYRDAAGAASSRRISVYSIRSDGPKKLYLVARCHERKATRTFRADRITACIDLDGVVHDDVAGYLAETFGIADFFPAGIRRDSELRTAFPLPDEINADVTLYAAMIDCDGTQKPEELVSALKACKSALPPGHAMLSRDGQVALVRHLIRRRPDLNALRRAAEEIQLSGNERMEFVFAQLVRILKADRIFNRAEAALLEALSLCWFSRLAFNEDGELVMPF